MKRANELREEAAEFERAAAYLFAQAERKRKLAHWLEKIDGAGDRLGGGTHGPLPRLAGTQGDGA